MKKYPVLWLLLGFSALAHAQWYEQEQAIMGTRIHVRLWAEEQSQGMAAIDAVMAEMRRVDEELSPYKPESALSQMNRDAGKGVVQLNPELCLLMEQSLRFSQLTGGAFDVSFASVGFQYDYRAHKKPNPEAIRKTLPAINYRLIELDAKACTVRFRSSQVKVDLGGIAKGYAVDQARLLLLKLGIKHASITAGGDTRLLGDRHGKPWMIGVQNPRDESQMVAVIPMEDGAVSTSGDYERYFEEDGVRYHHIIDPKTGDSARKVTSVTILGEQGIDTDALSTSVFVLGVKEGLALINANPQWDAVIVDAKGLLHYSDGLLRADNR